MRCSDALLIGCQELAERRDTQVHCHLLETQIQTVIANERYGTTMVKHLDTIGALSDRLSCAHTIWIDDDDIALLARRGAMVVHNPESNIRGGSGIAPVARMLRAGVTVALGADGSPSGGNQALQHAMSLATIIGRPHAAKFSDWVSTEDVMGMATMGGAKVMGLENDIAIIAPGRKADVVLYDTRSPWWLPLNNPINQMVHSESGSSARDVFIDGRHVVAEGRITTFDADAVLAEAQGHFDAVLGRNRDLMDLARRLGQAAQ
jgi:5-methylthioadenosine/S-adenosylhomocysteine deaminase